MSIQNDLSLAMDPVLFATKVLGIKPDPWQAGVLEYTGKRLIMNCSRQSGKSLTASIKALHLALYKSNSLVLLVSPSQRQSSELFRVVSDLTMKIDPPPRKVEDNRLSMSLANGSRIVSLPSKEGTVRGFAAVDLVVEDEASRVEDALYWAVRPMLAISGGQIILMSTPFGKRGHFCEVFTGKDPGWKRVEVKADGCPRISAAFLEEEKENLGEWFFKQEYECTFVESKDAVFSTAYLEAAMTDKFEMFAV